MGYLHQMLPQALENYAEEKAERVLEDAKEVRSPRQSRTDTHKLTETVAACTQPMQVQARCVLTLRRGSRQEPHP